MTSITKSQFFKLNLLLYVSEIYKFFSAENICLFQILIFPPILPTPLNFASQDSCATRCSTLCATRCSTLCANRCSTRCATRCSTLCANRCSTLCATLCANRCTTRCSLDIPLLQASLNMCHVFLSVFLWPQWWHCGPAVWLLMTSASCLARLWTNVVIMRCSWSYWGMPRNIPTHLPLE